MANELYYDIRMYTKLDNIMSQQTSRQVHLYQCDFAETQFIIVKTFKTSEEINADCLLMLKHNNHPNIVKVIGTFWKHRYLYIEDPIRAIIFEYCDLGDLRERTLQRKEFVKWIFEIGAAIKFLHDNNLIHGDIKPHNIFLQKKGVEIIAKLGDFDFFVVQNCKPAHTPGYRCPEAMLTYASDVFAFGKTIMFLWENVKDKGNGNIDFIHDYVVSDAKLRLNIDHFLDFKTAYIAEIEKEN